MAMKRMRDDMKNSDALATPKSLMLLSCIDRSSNRVFECKTCSRKFESFQALGGHRTSHKRTKLEADGEPVVLKPKTHECSICGVEFALGQALGGHMRRHRAAIIQNCKRANHATIVPVLNRSNSSKRVLCLDLSLRTYEIDLRLKL